MNKKLKNLGLGILSWYGYETLRASLESHKKGGLLELFGEKIIFFQEIDDEARAIAKQYGFEAHGNEKNVGIYGGFKGLAESMQSKYILLLENDFQLIKKFDEVKRQLSVGLDLLESGRAKKVTFRNRHSGLTQKNWDNWHKFYPPAESSFWRKLKALFWRVRRCGRNKQTIGQSIVYLQKPHEIFDAIAYDETIDFFFVSSEYRRWHNQAFLIERDFYINTILDVVEKIYVPKKFLTNGFKGIEFELLISNHFYRPPFSYILRHGYWPKQSWWQQQKYQIAISQDGAFTHNRLGYRGY